MNETCCIRPQLASLLDDIALTGPDALYQTKKAEVGKVQSQLQTCQPSSVFIRLFFLKMLFDAWLYMICKT